MVQSLCVDITKGYVQMIKYSNIWDAFYCDHCDKWLDKKCHETEPENLMDERGLPVCFFQCWNRPDKPSECNNLHSEYINSGYTCECQGENK